MKQVVKEEEVVKHWGVKIKQGDKWFWYASSEGLLWHSTCPRVANAQHDLIRDHMGVPDEELAVEMIK